MLVSPLIVSLSIRAKSLIALSVWAVLASCQPEQKASTNNLESDQPHSSKKGQLGQKVEIAPKVVLANWQDYFSEELLQGFVRETGIEIELHNYDNIEALEAVLQENNSKYDVVVAHSSYHSRFRDLQLIQKIGPNELSRINNIDKRFLIEASSPDRLYAVPYLWGMTTLAYHDSPEMTAPQSWTILWDPAFKGEIALLNDYEELIAVCLMACGHPLNSKNLIHLEEAYNKLPSLLANAMQVSEYDEVMESIASGEALYGMGYTGDVAVYASQGHSINTVIPDEGAIKWMDCLLITREAQHREEALAFIDYTLRPQVAAVNANQLAYMTPNEQAIGALNANLTNNPSLNPSSEKLSNCQYLQDPPSEVMELHNQFHATIQQRIRALKKSTKLPLPDISHVQNSNNLSPPHRSEHTALSAAP